jgi:hypothetical protein
MFGHGRADPVDISTCHRNHPASPGPLRAIGKDWK